MSDGKISYRASHDVTLITDSQYITVDKHDWTRLKREVNSCEERTDWWMNIAFTSYGIAGSAFFTWISLSNSIDNSPIRIVLLCTVVGCVLIGTICLFAHHSLFTNNEADIQDVKQVISDIEDKLSIDE